MPGFILIVREDLNRTRLPEEMQKSIQLHTQWAKQLSEQGIFIDGNGCYSEGKLVEWKDGKAVETELRDVKEGFGGYYLIEAKDLQEAIEIAKQNPTLPMGDVMEVRPLIG